MKKLFGLYWISLLAICLVACSENDEGSPSTKPDEVELTIPVGENLSPVLDAEGGTATISFTAASSWTANIVNTRADSWISVSPVSGNKGAATITLTVAPNDTPDERNATITLKCGSMAKDIVLSQKQKDALTVTSTKYEVAQQGGEIQVEVKTNVSFSVVIPETSKDWIKESGSGSRALETHQLNFSVDVNGETEKREGEIIIQSGELMETVHVYQAGGKIILLSKNDYPVSDQGEVIQIEVKSNCDYEVKMPDVDWIKETTQERALSTHTLYYEVSPNVDYDSRMAEIIFKDKASSLSDTLRIVQAQKDAILISKNRYEISSLGESIEVEYNTNVDCQIEIPSDCQWITLVDDVVSRSLTPHKAYFKIEPNDTNEPRTEKIRITDKNSQKVETIEVVQEGFNYYLRVPGHDENIPGVCDYKGGLFSLEVESDGPYKFEIVAEDTSWIRYLRTEERGENQFADIFSVDENDTGKLRECFLQVSLGPIVRRYGFKQAEKRELSFSQTVFNVSAAGGEFTMEVKANGTWALSMEPFYYVQIPDDASSWVSVEQNRQLGIDTDVAKLSVQPNLTNEQRVVSIKVGPFAGEEYYIQINQASQGTVVLSQSKYILSSDTHELTVDLATSDCTIEIDENTNSWITLGEKTGEGDKTKQTLIVASNTGTNERNGTITFSTADAKNQITVIQLMVPPALVDDTPAKWKQFQLPKVNLIFNNPDSEGSQIYKAIVPDCEELVNIASRKVLDCLYEEPGSSLIPRQNSLDYVLENYDGVSYNANSGERIVLSNQYLAQYYKTNGAEAMIKENIGILTHELTHSYQLQPQGCGGYQNGTHFHVFIEGVADAVRVLCGGFPNDDDRPKGGSYMNSYRFTGFFLAWLVNNKDKDFLRKFNMSAHVINPWSFDAGIKYALGDNYSADDLWIEYQKAMGDIK